MSADLLYLVSIIVGFLQYGVVAISNLNAGEGFTWNVDMESAATSSGPMAYIKDAFVILFGAYWIFKFWFGKELKRKVFIKKYLLWFFCVSAVGFLSGLVHENPFFFYVAGFRWLMLLNASIGFFAIFWSEKMSLEARGIYYWVLLFLLLSDLGASIFQQYVVSSAFGAGIGTARVVGLFSNAAISSFFALSCVMYVSLKKFSFRKKLFCNFVSILIAIMTGTRFVMISIVLVSLMVLYEVLIFRYGEKNGKTLVKVLSVPVLIGLFFGYEAMITLVGRGGIIEVASDEDGRFWRIEKALTLMFSSDIDVALVGAGIGMGTNTAATMAIAMGISDDVYTYNLLLDNAFLTAFLQLGVVGCAIFFGGLTGFIAKALAKSDKKYRIFVVSIIVLLTFFAGSPFEHFYLMICFGVAFGLVCVPAKDKMGYARK